MTEEVIVTQELLYLEYVLLGLQGLRFDDEIEKCLNELYRIVQSRFYDNLKYPHFDIDYVEYKMIYHYE